MIIKKEEYNPVLLDVMKFIADGKISELARLQFQKQQNLVAKNIGLSYVQDVGLLDIFEFCEQNNIDDESVQLLFSALKETIRNIKSLYGLS
jgi:hypothetical protein